FLSNYLETLNDAGNDFVLDAGVETFRVLPHDYQIEIWIATGNVRQGSNRPQVRVKIERFTQTNVDRRKAFAHRRGDRALESHLVPLNRFNQFVRQSLAGFIESLLAGDVSFPFDLDTGCFDDAHDGGGDFRSNPIARNQCDTMLH